MARLDGRNSSPGYVVGASPSAAALIAGLDALDHHLFAPHSWIRLMVLIQHAVAWASRARRRRRLADLHEAGFAPQVLEIGKRCQSRRWRSGSPGVDTGPRRRPVCLVGHAHLDLDDHLRTLHAVVFEQLAEDAGGAGPRSRRWIGVEEHVSSARSHWQSSG